MLRFLQSFPQWYDIDVALEEAINCTNKGNIYFDQAHGSRFNEFAKRQPEQVSRVLLEIDSKILKEKTNINSSDLILTNVRSELAKLRPLNDTMKNDKKKTAAQIQAWQKVCADLASAQSKFDSIKAKYGEGSSEYSKQESVVTKLIRSEEKYREIKDQKIEELNQLTIQYQKNVMEIIATAMKIMAQTRIDNSKIRIDYSKEIVALSEEIPETEDPSISTLLAELEQLDAEVVE